MGGSRKSALAVSVAAVVSQRATRVQVIKFCVGNRHSLLYASYSSMKLFFCFLVFLRSEWWVFIVLS